MKISNMIKRVISFVMAFILAIPSGVGNFAVTAQATETKAGGSPISINLEWMDSEFKNGSAFNLVEEDNTSNAVKMKVSYSSELIREEGYDPGALIITVKGIGNVNRSGPIEALVGADKEGSSIKTRDWTYTWNRTNDTYTLTNNEAIKGNSVFSGYFELVWSVNARDSIDRYTQNGMKASLYLPEGDSVSSNTLSFSNDTKADTFAVHIEQHEMYSYEGLTSGIANPDDYAFVRYNLGASKYLNSRGLQSAYYIFNPDANGVGSGAVVISPKISYSELGDGTYRVTLSSDTRMESQYIFVAYPKNRYTEQTVTASIAKYGAYYEGDDFGNNGTLQLAIDTIDVLISNDFRFTDIPGNIYDFSKDTYYDKNVSYDNTQAKGGDIRGVELKTGTTETFYLQGSLNNPTGIYYTFEIVDDFLYIIKNDGTFRQLEAGEYSFDSITIPAASSLLNTNNIPIASDTYKVFIYTAYSGSKVDTINGTLAWEGFLTDYKQCIPMENSPTAIAIVIQDIAESISKYSIPVDIKFHIKDTSGLVSTEQDNLTSGQVVNTSFIKLYTKQEDESYAWINNEFTEANYQDDTNLNLAQKDLDVYGSYLDRERDNITFYAGEKNDYFAHTQLSEIFSEGSRFATKFTMGANFYFKEEDHPNQFSLYTILDKALSLSEYRNQEDIWDIITLSGMDMSERGLVNACTPEIITDYKGSGRTYIALHFDFGDTQVSQESQIRAEFKMRVDNEVLKNSYSIRGRSAVIIDEDILEYPVRKVFDAGSWGDSAELFIDIDRDGNTEETLTYSFDNINHIYADSSQMQLTKYVKTTYSDGWTQQPEIPYEEYGGIYKYNLYLKSGNSQATNIVVRDILEVGENMQWQGTFQSVDLSKCEEAGLSGTVYYSDSDSPSEDITSADWTTTQPATVKAVAIDFGNSVLKEGKELNIIVNMKAPEDVSLQDKITENGYSASFTMTDSVTGNVTKYDDLVSNFVQVKLTPPLRNIILTKEDAENGERLSGAKFALIHKETEKTVAEITSNERGYAIFRKVPSDAVYIIREIVAPVGYERIADIEVAMNGTDQRISVKDPRKTGRIEVYKVNSLDEEIPVAGAEYTLYDADGNAASTAITDANGVAVFTDVAWGSYTVKETASPAGYQLNEKEYSVEINRENVSEIAIVDTVDVQDDVSMSLTKYVATTTGEKTEIPLPGATFELVRKVGDAGKRMGLYVTDADGKIDLVELPYGDYYFREYRAPAGYATAENVGFTLSSDNKDVALTVYNQRKPGSVIINKKDNLGNLVKDVEFGLFDKAYTEEELKSAKPIQTAETDEYGVAEFKDLEWGTYYVLETKAPDCYHMDTQWKEVIIDGKNLSVTLDVINETKKGTIILTKTDEAGIIFLNGAEYTLYQDDGTVIGVYTTQERNGESGKLVVENLEWGSYYFKETKAPEGYNLSNETIRFSVNSLNAGLTQEIEVTDPLDARSITITKRIKADDINFDNGNPTFMFKIEGQDTVNLENHIYYRVITFDENYVRNHVEVIDGENWVSQSITISGMMIGHYMITEEDSSRYYLTEITDITNGLAKQPSYSEDGTETASVMPMTEGPVFDPPDEVGAKINLYEYEEGAATFVNERYENQDFSDTKVVTNVLKEKAKLTALKAVYGADTAEAESTVDRSILTVTAFYDDGTSKILNENDYTLDINTFPNQNGDYTVTASYEENGITRRDNFKVTLYGMKSRIVSLEASLVGGSTIETNSMITGDMFNVTAIYNDGTRKALAHPATVKSPNYPNKYPNGMTLDKNYWEHTFTGADSILVTFSADSETYKDYDYIYIYDKSGKNVSGKLYSTNFAGQTYTVQGDYVKLAMRSTTNLSTRKGFCATITPVYNGTPISQEYIVSPATAPSTDGQFDVTINLNLDVIPNSGREVSTTVAMVAEYPEPLLINNYWASDGTATKTIIFTDEVAPDGVTVKDVSEGRNGSVVAWSVDGTKYISSQRKGVKVIANTDCREMFSNNAHNLEVVDASMLDTSRVQNMKGLFYYVDSLTSVNLSGWDTGNVVNMASMFERSTVTSLDLSGWDTSSVQKMSRMFYLADDLTTVGDLSNWQTGNVTDMSEMFYGCYKLTSLGDISNWNTEKVTDMNFMFRNCTNLTSLNLSGWNVSGVLDMNCMFYGCSKLTSLDLSGWDTANVGDMSEMFRDCKKLTSLDLSNWKTGKVNSFDDMFTECNELTSVGDLGEWDTSTATTMDSMFTNCYKLTYVGNLDRWDTSNVSNMESMFANCTVLTSVGDLSGWKTGEVTTMKDMFTGCNNLSYVGNLKDWDTSNVTNMEGMFAACAKLTSLDLSGWDTSKVTDMSGMFQSTGLTSLTFGEKWNTSNVTDMNFMFGSVYYLTSLEISDWDTSKVTNMDYMFYRASSLKSLDLRGWNTFNVTTMKGMFEYCTSVADPAYARSTQDAARLNATENKPTSWYFVSVAPTIELEVQLVDCPEYIKVNVPDVVDAGCTEIKVIAEKTGIVTSFKLDGVTIEGDTFLSPMESGTVTISDVIVATEVIIESEHNPYPNSVASLMYGEADFEGASTLTVVLDYQTESTSYDWIYLYDANNNIINNKKYGGSTRKQETITVTGSYVKIIFRTDGSGNDYYGFKAVVTPNY